jgi:hypothetical protein
MPRFSFIATCSSLLVLVACGDPLVGADYLGEPLMVLAGQVLVEEALPALQGEATVAIFWSSQGEHASEHQQQTEIGTSFPSLYTVTLFTPPPDEVLYQPPHAPGAVAIGVPIVFDDADLDGRYDDGDTLLGGSADVLVLFATEPMGHGEPPEEGGGGGGPGDTHEPREAGEPLEEGYHAVSALGRSCDEGSTVLSLADPHAVDLVLGELSEHLVDMDCDGDTDEWF